MELLAFFLSLFFGADVQRLGDRDYATRAAAHRRLARAGVWAVPVLDRCRPANPEAAHRVALLLGGATDWRVAVADAAVDGHGVTADLIDAVAFAADLDERLAAEVYRRVDLSGKFCAARSRCWVEAKPYMSPSKTKAGDFAYMLTETRRRKILVEVPQAMPMPPNCWE